MRGHEHFLEWIKSKVKAVVVTPETTTETTNELTTAEPLPKVGFIEQFDFPAKQVPDVYTAITKDNMPTAPYLERKRMAGMVLSPEVAKILRDLSKP
jgi:hypothetical protein